MRYLAITLEQFEDRVEYSRQQQEAFGREFEIIPAIYGMEEDLDSLPVSRINSLYRIGRTLNPGEIGCALSHHRTLENIVDGGEPAFVAEDDVCFSFNGDALDGLMGTIPQGANFINLQRQEHGDVETLPSVNGFQRIYAPAFGTSAQVIFPSAAEILLKSFLPVSEPIDVYYIRMAPKLQAYYPPGDEFVAAGGGLPSRTNL